MNNLKKKDFTTVAVEKSVMDKLFDIRHNLELERKVNLSYSKVIDHVVTEYLSMKTGG